MVRIGRPWIPTDSPDLEATEGGSRAEFESTFRDRIEGAFRLLRCPQAEPQMKLDGNGRSGLMSSRVSAGRTESDPHEPVLGVPEHRQDDLVGVVARKHPELIGARRAQSLGEEIGRKVSGRQSGFDLRTRLSLCRARECGTRNDRPARRWKTSLRVSRTRDRTDYA